MTMLVGAPFTFAQSNDPVEQGAPNVPQFQPAFPEQTRAPDSDSGVRVSAEKFAAPLAHPWGIDMLPGGGYLVTERAGRLRVISEDGKLSEPVAGMPEVVARKQGGLLDVTAGPNFAEDRMIYWTYSKPLGQGRSATAAARGRLSEDLSRVSEVEDIFVQEPPSRSPMHYGSRILFDGEGHAFITTGEHFTEKERKLAQELDATYGKVIRITLDGSVPEDNPFVDRQGAIGSIWSYGHRNIQGAAIHPETGELWVIEHGPKGGDEVNIPQPGKNYG
jgi:glucose/arabinose dehydrogenase